MNSSTSETHQQNNSWSGLLSGRNGLYALALSVGISLHALNMYLSTTMLPSIVKDIGGLNWYAWNTTLFVLTSIISASASGLLLTRYGARSAYHIASIFLFLGTFLAGIAPHMPVMLLGRAIQGLGGGLLLALSYAMIMRLFAQSLWPRAMALLSAMWGIATLIGPAIGGMFSQWEIWRWAFIGLLPLILIYMTFCERILPTKNSMEETDQQNTFPFQQLIWLALAVLSISIGGLNDSGLINLFSIMLGLILIERMLKAESKARIKLFPSQTFVWGSGLFYLFGSMFLLIFAMTSEIYIPYYLQILKGQSPLLAGYISVLIAIGWAISEVYSAGWQGRAMQRAVTYGPYLVILGIASLSLSLSGHGTHIFNLGLISASLLFAGFGIGMGWPHLSSRALKIVPQHEQQIIASAMTTIQMFAASLGTSIAGMVVNITGINQANQIQGASQSAFWLFIIFALLTLPSIYTAKKAAGLNIP